jgi:hypothetical protein
MYEEYVGLTGAAIALIEGHRKSPQESKSDILIRVLTPLAAPQRSEKFVDVGQGVRLRVGESIVLFLSKEDKQNERPAAKAEIRKDGFFLHGRKKISPSKGSVIHPAMRLVQAELKHRNDKGEIVSLNAYRQWHALRDGKLVPLDELKDPALRRTRGRRAAVTLEDLGLA